MSRFVILVLDGVGAGEMPDAALFDDVGSNTLGNLARAVGGLHLPYLQSLGLGNILPLEGVPPAVNPLASYGRLAESSPAKDSTTGHWELLGLPSTVPPPYYHSGFPPEILEPFCRAIGVERVLGNKAASGTEIIVELGAEHLATGLPIVYTSADSVFQIATHKDIVPLEKLYEWCKIARGILTGPYALQRVIARPFDGPVGKFHRTEERRDFSLVPFGPTLLDLFLEAGIPTIGIGKVDDLFGHRGFSATKHTTNLRDGLAALEVTLGELERGLVLVNLIEFDMLWGHRNDCAGFAQGLEGTDPLLEHALAGLRPGDVLVITADHGNDPTTPSTDHSREYVPLLVLAPGKPGRDLVIRASFADVAASAAAFFGHPGTGAGKSFL